MRTFLLHAAAAASSHHRSTTASSSFDDALLRHLDPECISRGIARAAGVLPLREPAARQKSYARTFRLDAAYRGGRNVARGRHLAEIPSGSGTRSGRLSKVIEPRHEVTQGRDVVEAAVGKGRPVEAHRA